MADKTLTQLGQIADEDIGDSILAYVAFGGISYKMTANQFRTEYLDDYYQPLISGGTEDAIATYDGSGSLQEGGISLLAQTFSWATGNATFKHNITDNDSVVDIKGNGNSYSGELRAYNDDDTDYASVTYALTKGQVFRSIAAATQDALQLQGRAGGTGSFIGTMTTTTLSASRTYTFPDLSGVIAIEPASGWVEGASNLTTQYRLMFVTSVGVATGSSSIVTDASGNLNISSARLDIVNTLGDQLRLSDTVTDDTAKRFMVTGRHYSNEEEDTLYLYGRSTSDNTSEMLFGGGSSSYNSITAIRFFTAATGITTSGTERLRINSSGNVLIGTTSQYASELFAVNGQAAINDDLILPKTSGKGIKVDPVAPTFGWRDMTGRISVRGLGGTDPSFAVYRGSIRQQQFSVNDEAYVEFHMPHDYVPGTDLFIHTHWSHADGSVVSGGVTWSFELSYSKGHDQAPFPATVTSTVTQTASTTQYQHMIAEVQCSAAAPSGSQIDSDDLEVDGLILCRVYLSGNTINGTPEPFLHFVDIHYQSTNLSTKQKAPNFYV